MSDRYQSLLSESEAKYTPVRRRKIQISPTPGEQISQMPHWYPRANPHPMLCLPRQLYIRELKQQRRRRLQKRHLKSEFAPLQTLLRLFNLIYFVKCWQKFLELNSKGLYQSSGKEKKVVVLCSRPRQNMNTGTFTL